jgi:short-subunit dehydrogenase
MENSAALVTGASKGIGKEIARQLTAAGFGLIRRGAEF